MRPLEPFFLGYPNAGQFKINQPGQYAIDKDIVVHKQWGAGHTGPNGGEVVSINCGHAIFDLGGHSIDVRYGLSGIGLDASVNREWARKHSDSLAGVDNRFVMIRNGSVVVLGGGVSDSGIEFTDAWRQPAGQYFAHGADTHGAGDVPKSVSYVRNDYHFEGLKVRARGLGIAAEGGHTVIRNCIIESAGNAGIFCAGPDVLIENCEIRLRPLVEGQNSYYSPLRAAIVLRDASNAIIRNNRIRVDRGGLPSDTRCILVRDGATNVVVENNTFINVDEGDWITTMDDAVVTSRGNKTEHRWQPW
jgi:hypothetical protein